LTLLPALIVAAALIAAAQVIAARLRERQSATALQATVRLFAPALAEISRDPRALLVWQPLAILCRTLDPDTFARLDRAAGATFPFGREAVQSAHARWTTDWLAWERAHDAEYKLRCSEAEEAIVASGGAAPARARLDAIEREKLETYQRRYEDYVRVAKALQQLDVGAS
jgi:hypothetical protein